MSLAALEATLQLMRDPDMAKRELPLYAMLTQSVDDLYQSAQTLGHMLGDIQGVDTQVVKTQAQVGGGSTPGQMIPSMGLSLHPLKGSVEALGERLRVGHPPVIGRIQHDSLVVDMRSLLEGQLPLLAQALKDALVVEEENRA